MDINYKEFEAITAFEVFEHLPLPVEGINEMLSFGKTIIFSTELIPKTGDVSEWSYLVPEVGQHVSFYHLKTLQVLSAKLNLNLYSNGHNLHILTDRKLNNFMFKLFSMHKVSLAYNLLLSGPDSLLESDYQSLKKILLRDLR